MFLLFRLIFVGRFYRSTKIEPFSPPLSLRKMVYKYIRNDAGEFICPHCPDIKKNQNTMHYHMKKHEGDLPHECRYCKQRFLHSRVLNLHVSAKHADQETPQEKDYICPSEGCDYLSLTKANRRIHYFRVHMKDIIAKSVTKEEDKFICNCCNKEMNSQTSLYYHLGDCIKMPGTDIRIPELNEILA